MLLQYYHQYSGCTTNDTAASHLQQCESTHCTQIMLVPQSTRSVYAHPCIASTSHTGSYPSLFTLQRNDICPPSTLQSSPHAADRAIDVARTSVGRRGHVGRLGTRSVWHVGVARTSYARPGQHVGEQYGKQRQEETKGRQKRRRAANKNEKKKPQTRRGKSKHHTHTSVKETPIS